MGVVLCVGEKTAMGFATFPKNPDHSNTSGYFLRKGWNYCHTSAFLIDSQAKIP
jgi:hypothetical protein